MGFPIRKSADQSFFAAPRGLSQRSTSFIASQRQGIHRMPLSHLIALIINAQPARQRSRSSVHANDSTGRTLNRKTSLLRIVPTACGQAADIALAARARARRLCIAVRRDHVAMLGDCASIATLPSRPTLGAILPLHDVRYHATARSLAARRMRKTFSADETRSRLVEPDGIEPTTSCLQSRRSPN